MSSFLNSQRFGGIQEIMLNNFRDGVYRTLGTTFGSFQGNVVGGATINTGKLVTSADGDYADITVPPFAGDFAMVAELAVTTVGASSIGSAAYLGPSGGSRYASFYWVGAGGDMRAHLNSSNGQSTIVGLTRVVVALTGGVVKRAFNGGTVGTGGAESWPDTPSNTLLMGNGYGSFLGGSDYTHHMAGGFLYGVRIVKGTFTNAELQALTLTSTLP